MHEEEPSWDTAEVLIRYLNVELKNKYGVKIESYDVHFGKTKIVIEGLTIIFEAKYFNAYNYSHIMDKILDPFTARE